MRANVTAASSTSLSVTVPIGATYQPISVAVNNLVGFSKTPFSIAYGMSGAVVNASSFAAAVNLGGGGFVTEGDVDGDGKVDLVYTSFSGNSVTVLQNTSTVATVAFASTPVGGLTNPISAKAADLNGDGLLDLIVANPTFSVVYVLKNTSIPGTVSFAAVQSFGTGTGPRKIATADMDGDGRVDVVVSNQSDNSVSVLRNASSAGTISFAAKTDYAVTANPEGVAVGDLDGDGKPEIATAGYAAAGLASVLKNNSTPGSLSFATKVDYAAEAFPWDVAIADLDGDGKAELAVSNSSPNTVSVFRNTGISSLSFAAPVSLPTASTPRGLSVGDLDADGKPDLVTANYFSTSRVSVLKNNSTSGAIAFASYVEYTTNTGPGNVVLADLNGDGLMDITSANSNSNSLSFLRNALSILPQCPQLLFPANSATNVAYGVPLTLRWRKDATASGYNVKVTAASGAVVTQTVTDTIFQFTPAAGETFTWSATPTGLSTTCAGFTFSTCTGTAGIATLSAATTAKCGTDTIVIRTTTLAFISPQWFLNNATLPGATADSFKAVLPGDYTVRFGNGPCYSAPSNTITITNLPTPAKPTLSYSTQLTFCAGGSVTLTSSVNSNNQWFKDAAAIGGAAATIYSVTQNGQYFVRVSNAASGCHNYSDTVTVTVKPVPATPTATPLGPVTFCTGDSVRLQSSSTTNNQWYDGGAAIGSANGEFFTAKSSGVYTVRTTLNGCASAGSNGIAVTVNPIPFPPTVTASGSLTFCPGDSVRLQSSVANGNQWLKNGAAITGATGQQFWAKEAATYTVRTTASGCTSGASAASVTSLLPSPAQPAVTGVGNLLSTSVGYAGYQWYFNNAPIAGATAAQYTTAQNGIYKVEVTSPNGCKISSADFNQTATAVSEVVWSDYRIRLYPNPVQDKLTLQVTSQAAAARGLTAQVVDGHGKLLQTVRLKAGVNAIYFNGLPAGLYSVVLKAGTQQNAIQVVKAN